MFKKLFLLSLLALPVVSQVSAYCASCGVRRNARRTTKVANRPVVRRGGCTTCGVR